MRIDYYSTSDLSVTAFLQTLGFKLMSIDSSNSSRCSFNFQDDEKINEAVDDYNSGRARIDPLIFTNHLKQLKFKMANLKNY